MKAIDIPSKIRFPRITVPCQSFESLSDESVVSFYAVNSHEDTNNNENSMDTAIYTFCSYCGVNILYSPSINPSELMVNADCLDKSTVKDYTVSYVPCKETTPAVANASEIFKECNRRGSGASYSTYNCPTHPTPTNSQRQHPSICTSIFPSPMPAMYALTPQKVSSTLSSSSPVISNTCMDSNCKASYDLYLKTAAASVLSTPSTASPNTDLSSGHTTGSAGKSSADNNYYEWTSYSDHTEQCHNESVFFHNWSAVSSEVTDENRDYESVDNDGDNEILRQSVNKLEIIKRELPIKYQHMFTNISPLKGTRLGARSIDSANVLFGTPMHRQLQYHLKAHLKNNQEQSQAGEIGTNLARSDDVESEGVQNVCV